MGKKERDEVLSEISARIFSAMWEDALMDVVLESHQAIARSRKVCDICHTYCGQVHIPGVSGSAVQTGASSSRVATPTDETRTKSPSVNGANPSGSGKTNGNVLLECVNCKRQMASNRYASHLADCMGLGSSRRGAVRNASSKAKVGSDAGSASPYLGTEDGVLSDDGQAPLSGKSKAKSKAKRADDAEFNLHRKRPGSPNISPRKNTKKAKTAGTPAARVKADPDTTGSIGTSLSVPLTGTQSRVPSKLRDSSVVSSIQRDLSSSPELPSPAPSISTLASAPSMQSPTLSASTTQKASGKKGKPIPPPQRRLSPPRLPPPPVIRMPEPDYLVDVEGDETGSSTDTDSD